MEQVCAKYLRRLVEKTRKDNDEALRLIYARGVTQIALEPAEVERYKELWDQAIGDIEPKSLPRDYLSKVMEILKAYRAGQGAKQ